MSGTFHGALRKAQSSKRNPLPAGSRIVIIGNGMVSAKLCSLLVEDGLQSKYQIQVIGDEVHPAYNRVKLSTYVGHRDPESLQLFSREWYEQNNITLKTGVRAQSINREEKLVIIPEGDPVAYDLLILATGSRPNIPPIPGADSKNVYLYRTLIDLDEIMKAAKGKKSATIIGGGLLGLEAAQALQSLNLQTSVIEHSHFLMPQQLNTTSARIVQQKLLDQGITPYLGTKETIISEIGDQLALKLNQKIQITTDLVLISAGIIPNSELAESCDLPVGIRGGIIVDDHLETEDPNIFAMGECALLHGRIYGLVAPGYIMARHIADRIQGKKVKSLLSLDMSTRLKMLGIDVTTIGEALQEGRRLEFTEGDTYRMLVLGEKRKLIGALAIGPWDENSQIHSLYSRGGKISQKQENHFLQEGFLFPNQTQQSPETWEDSRVVCNCLTITKGEITACVAQCQSDPDQVATACGASTVCGSCRPLIEQFCGATPTTTKKSLAIPALLITSIISLLIVAYSILFPAASMATSVESTWYKIDQLWRDNFIKQITGYSLMGIFLIGLLISLRKRFAWFKWGNFTSWRFFHSAFGLTALGALWAHTGFHFGSNLNFWLMFVFVILNLLGAVAGIVSAIEAKGTTSAAMIARRLRPTLTWAHIIFFWPLPVLLTFHILSVYLY